MPTLRPFVGLRSARLGHKLRRLVSLGRQLSDNSTAVSRLSSELTGLDTAGDLSVGRSCLNSDSTPLQLCLTSSGSEAALRLIGDPGANSASIEERFALSLRTLLHALETNGASELTPLSKSTVAMLIPPAPEDRLAYRQGFVWIAACPDRPGVSFYLEMAPLEPHKGWQSAEDWLAHILPSSVAATAVIRNLRQLCLPASAGLEGSTLENARAKIYFRLKNPAPLSALGVDLFSSAEMTAFVECAMRSHEVDRDGLVMSVGFRLSTGELADVKLDLCGHCLTHSPSEWSSIIAQLQRRFDLHTIPAESALESGEFRVAFIGFGLTTDHSPRLNLYLNHRGAPGPPEPAEVEYALRDALSYLQSIQSEDGSWTDYQLPVGPSDQWVTACAALALARGGRALSNAAADAAAMRGALWLARNRTYPAGWGYNGATGPDSDSTALAIALFDEIGIAVPRADRLFLRDHWREGGVATYSGPQAWGEPHWDVTPWAYHGMSIEDREALRPGFLAALNQNSNPDGFWRSYWWRNPYYSTFATLEVLSRLGIPEPAHSASGTGPSLRIDNPFDLGCYIGIESLRDRSDPRIGGHLRALLNWQARDGSWPGAANLRVTDPACYFPWQSPQGEYYEDLRSVITTSTIARVLCSIAAGR